jgi:hypothetical protein
MIKDSLVIDTYEDCNNIGIYLHGPQRHLWGYWFEEGRELYSTKGEVIFLSHGCLGRW